MSETRLDDEEIRRFASSDAGGEMSVIVEVAVPPVHLLRGQALGPARRGLDAATAQQRSQVGNENLQRVLAALDAAGLRRAPNVLPAAYAVVASVTPEQLRSLIALPGIAQIRRNRSVTAGDA